ncbi:cysteine hydrolase [Fundidesulfovibrio butyratiphilus]
MNSTSALESFEQQVQAFFTSLGRPAHVFPLRPEKAALLVIDMQQFSCAPSHGAPFPGLAETVDHMNRLVDACHEQRIPVIWVRHSFHTSETGDDAGLYPCFHKQPLSRGMFDEGPDTALYHAMHYDAAVDYVVFKNRYSAFASTRSELPDLLRRLALEQLWVAGVVTNVCVESTARDAMQRDYEVILVADAVTSPFALAHAVALLNFRVFFGDVRTVDDVVSALGTSRE